MVGPGVAARGVESDVWSDHVDVRPTVLSLVGLLDDYRSDGRVLPEILDGHQVNAAPGGGHSNSFLSLARMYKRINAPVGELGLASLAISTRALESGNAGDDSQYANLQSQLAAFTTQRDALAEQMIALLEGAEFHGQKIDPQQSQSLVQQGQALLDAVNAVANGQ